MTKTYNKEVSILTFGFAFRTSMRKSSCLRGEMITVFPSLNVSSIRFREPAGALISERVGTTDTSLVRSYTSGENGENFDEIIKDVPSMVYREEHNAHIANTKVMPIDP